MADPSKPITESLEKILKDLPTTGRGFSETAITTNGWRSEVGHKINASWQVSAYAGSQWGKNPEAGVLLKGKW